jgi:hypothetical protein
MEFPASQSFNNIDLYVPIGFARCPLRHQPRHVASDMPYLGLEVLKSMPPQILTNLVHPLTDLGSPSEYLQSG